jgi:hypothetical protein
MLYLFFGGGYMSLDFGLICVCGFYNITMLINLPIFVLF